MSYHVLKLDRHSLNSTLRALSASPVGPVLLTLALVLLLGILVGYSVAKVSLIVAIVLVAAIPISIIYIRQPFAAVLTWLILGPFVMLTPDATTRALYWLVHRAIIPLCAVIAWVAASARRRTRFDLVDLFMLAYLLINIFSVLYYHPRESAKELYHVYDWVLVGTVLFWLIRTTAPRETQLKQLVVALIVLSIAQGVVGLLMNIPATRAILPQYWIETSAGRTGGTLGRVAEFSSTLTASMLLLAHFMFNTRKGLAKLLCVIALLLGSICLVLSFSRGTWLASAIVAALTIVLYRRLTPYILILAAVIALVLSTSIMANYVAYANERLTYQRTVDSRLVSDYAALEMIKAKPLLGWGYDNFLEYHLDYVRPVAGIATQDIRISSHHTYLGLAAELGLLGLAAYLLPWLLLLKRSISSYKQLPREGLYSRRLLTVLWLGVTFWFVVTNFMNMRLASWGITWIQLLLGLIASVVDATRQVPYRHTADSLATRSSVHTGMLERTAKT